MPKAEDGIPYDDWKAENAMDPLGAAYQRVTIYDAQGRPQLTTGSGVESMLDKVDDNGRPYFFPYRVEEGIDVEEEIVYRGVSSKTTPTPTDACPHCAKRFANLPRHVAKVHP